MDTSDTWMRDVEDLYRNRTKDSMFFFVESATRKGPNCLTIILASKGDPQGERFEHTFSRSENGAVPRCNIRKLGSDLNP